MITEFNTGSLSEVWVYLYEGVIAGLRGSYLRASSIHLDQQYSREQRQCHRGKDVPGVEGRGMRMKS